MRQMDDSFERSQIQANADDRDTAVAAPARAHVPSGARVDELLAGGQDVQTAMGSAFQTDFSSVSIAADGKAEQLGAQAYAQGDSVHLAAGKGAPSSREGVALLGHELAHVQQQRAGRVDAAQGKGAPVVADPALEEEADRAGAAIADGQPVAAQLLGGSTSGAGRAAQRKEEGAPIQLLEGDEHRDLGNSAKGVPTYHWQNAEEKKAGTAAGAAGAPGFKFIMTHGDMVCLSGDLFDPRDNDEKKMPIRDSLFRIASTPSSDIGKKVGTQDEIIYAIKNYAGKGDPRFEAAATPDGLGGIWHGIEFSAEVKQSVDSRYLRLAADNPEHFAEPSGPGSGGAASGNRASAGGTYRHLHEDAILRAHDAKKDGRDHTGAMAREGAAQHFVTDAFAGGHVRTRRTSLLDHWDAMFPLFFENFKQSIAHDTAIYINENETNLATVFGSASVIQDKIWAQVQEKTADFPAFTFGGLVGKIIHDVDNDSGLFVTNDLGMKWKAYGDGKLVDNPEKTLDNKHHAEVAVQLGVDDIKRAHALDPTLSDDAVKAEVKASAPAPAVAGDKYGAEQMMPRLDTSVANGKQAGLEPSITALWNAPARDDAPKTFGAYVKESMDGGALGSQLDSFAQKFPEEESGVHPRSGFIKGFVKPMKDSPLSRLNRIINYDPSIGHAGFNTDDVVMDYLGDLDKSDKKDGKAKGSAMEGLTFPQRTKMVRELIDGSTSDSEGERVVQIFKTADPSERPQIYQAVEGHAWNGDWVEGYFTDDDDIWNALSSGQLSRLKVIMNGG